MRNNVLLIASLAALTLSALAGCTASAASGATAIYVKDAPADGLLHLNVTFSKVTVHREGDGQSQNKSDEKKGESGDDFKDHEGREVEAGEDNDTSEAGWITVVSTPATVDLKNFSGNAKSFIGDQALEPGRYNGIRIYVTAATAVLANGTTVDLKVPSKAIKIKGHFTVVDGKETDLTLDFNLEKAVEMHDGKYMLKPHAGLKLASSTHDRPGESDRKQRQDRREREEKRHHDDK